MKYSQFVYELAEVLKSAETEWVRRDNDNDPDLEEDHFKFEAIRVMEFINEWHDRR